MRPEPELVSFPWARKRNILLQSTKIIHYFFSSHRLTKRRGFGERKIEMTCKGRFLVIYKFAASLSRVCSLGGYRSVLPLPSPPRINLSVSQHCDGDVQNIIAWHHVFLCLMLIHAKVRIEFSHYRYRPLIVCVMGPCSLKTPWDLTTLATVVIAGFFITIKSHQLKAKPLKASALFSHCKLFHGMSEMKKLFVFIFIYLHSTIRYT